MPGKGLHDQPQGARRREAIAGKTRRSTAAWTLCRRHLKPLASWQEEGRDEKSVLSRDGVVQDPTCAQKSPTVPLPPYRPTQVEDRHCGLGQAALHNISLCGAHLGREARGVRRSARGDDVDWPWREAHGRWECLECRNSLERAPPTSQGNT